MREKISASLKQAMKAGDKRRVSTLRLINAAIKDRDIEARGAGRGPLADQELHALLQKMIRQREESRAIYERAGRADLAAQEREEIEILTAFLPQQLSEAEMREAIAAAIRATDAVSVKDTGKVMAVLRAGYAGRIDLAKAGATVRARLCGQLT